MPVMTFRFTTECEMSLSGETYEEAYLKFKDFLHGQGDVQFKACIDVCPPETDQVFFRLEDHDELHEIPQFKGAFKEDIAQHCSRAELRH